jgi:hypothetical protein
VAVERYGRSRIVAMYESLYRRLMVEGHKNESAATGPHAAR